MFRDIHNSSRSTRLLLGKRGESQVWLHNLEVGVFGLRIIGLDTGVYNHVVTCKICQLLLPVEQLAKRGLLSGLRFSTYLAPN